MNLHESTELKMLSIERLFRVEALWYPRIRDVMDPWRLDT
jgi:hypothetical protein